MSVGDGSARRALLVVDVQNDFCEGGSLAVAGGAAVAAGVAELLGREGGEGYAAVVATADWHIDPGSHFSDEPDFVDSWPVHCVAGTTGGQFHPSFTPALTHVDAVFRKGEYSAAYSGFEGVVAGDDSAGSADSVGAAGAAGAAGSVGSAGAAGAADAAGDGGDGSDGVGLADWLRQHDITEVDVVGIATDHCVRATALDAAREGLHVRVLLDLCAGVAPASTRAALDELTQAGVVAVGA